MEEQNLDSQKKKIHLIEAVALAAVLVLGIAVYFFAKSPARQTEFTNQNGGQGATQPAQVVEAPKETFVAQENVKISYGNEKVSATETKKLPSAEKFKTFFYDSKIGKVIEIAGTCSDFYYTIVVFKSTNDYKTNPAMAKVNNAFECPASHIFKTSLNLRDFNLAAGEYYFFVADQGKTGTWYNPR